MNKLIKNASWIIGCRIGQMLLGFVISMMTAQYLGPAGYGMINYAQAFVVFCTPIVYLGLSNILVQEVVNCPEEEGTIVGSTLFYSTISAVVCIIGVILIVFVINIGETEKIVVCALFSLILIFYAWEQVQYWFQAKLLSKYYSIVTLIAYTAASVFKLYLLATRKDVFWFVATYVLESGIISVSMVVLYKKMGGQKLRVSSKKAKEMVRRSSPYILSAMMVTICSQTDKIMLDGMLDSSATGFYSAATMLTGLTMFVYQAVIDSFRPKLFEDLKESKEKFERGVVELYSVVIFVSLIQSLVMTLLAKYIVLFTYKKAYLPSVPALQVAVWYTTFSYIGVIRNIWILAENQQKILTVVYFSGAVANVILNLCLIPSWGIVGAAAASLCSQICTNVVIGFFLKGIRHNNELLLRALDPRIAFRVMKIIIASFKSRED